jgi:hypothetical protein
VDDIVISILHAPCHPNFLEHDTIRGISQMSLYLDDDFVNDPLPASRLALRRRLRMFLGRIPAVVTIWFFGVVVVIQDVRTLNPQPWVVTRVAEVHFVIGRLRDIRIVTRQWTLGFSIRRPVKRFSVIIIRLRQIPSNMNGFRNGIEDLRGVGVDVGDLGVIKVDVHVDECRVIVVVRGGALFLFFFLITAGEAKTAATATKKKKQQRPMMMMIMIRMSTSKAARPIEGKIHHSKPLDKSSG